MKIAFFSAKKYEIKFFDQFNTEQYDFQYIDQPLTEKTASLAAGCEVVCCFVLDCLDTSVLKLLKASGVKLIALRSAGFDHVDLLAADVLSLPIVHVPEYSPEAVAEFAAGLLLSITRKIPQALKKSEQHDYTLSGLMGFNLSGKTVGIVGAGRIGLAFARIMKGFGCEILFYDPFPSSECIALGAKSVQLEELFSQSDVISLHCLLNRETKKIINAQVISTFKSGVILINTGRGALIDSQALLDGLNSGKVGAAGLDVYDKEAGLFFTDHSKDELHDLLFLELQSHANVLITGHVAFFSKEAVANIAHTTIENIKAFLSGHLRNQVGGAI